MSAASCWTTLALSLAPSFSNRSTSEPQARQARCNGWQPISAWKLRHSCTTLREMMEDGGWGEMCWRYLLPALDGMKQPVILRRAPRWGSHTKQVTARRSVKMPKQLLQYLSASQAWHPGVRVKTLALAPWSPHRTYPKLNYGIMYKTHPHRRCLRHV